MRPSTQWDADDRQRDLRPGHYAVRGPFIDLSQIEDPEEATVIRRGA